MLNYGFTRKHLYETAHNFDDGVNTAINLMPNPMNRFTLTDGILQTEEIVRPLSSRDEYIADRLENWDRSICIFKEGKNITIDTKNDINRINKTFILDVQGQFGIKVTKNTSDITPKYKYTVSLSPDIEYNFMNDEGSLGHWNINGDLSANYTTCNNGDFTGLSAQNLYVNNVCDLPNDINGIDTLISTSVETDSATCTNGTSTFVSVDNFNIENDFEVYTAANTKESLSSLFAYKFINQGKLQGSCVINFNGTMDNSTMDYASYKSSVKKDIPYSDDVIKSCYNSYINSYIMNINSVSEDLGSACFNVYPSKMKQNLQYEWHFATKSYNGDNRCCLLLNFVNEEVPPQYQNTCNKIGYKFYNITYFTYCIDRAKVNFELNTTGGWMGHSYYYLTNEEALENYNLLVQSATEYPDYYRNVTMNASQDYFGFRDKKTLPVVYGEMPNKVQYSAYTFDENDLGVFATMGVYSNSTSDTYGRMGMKYSEYYPTVTNWYIDNYNVVATLGEIEEDTDTSTLWYNIYFSNNDNIFAGK